MENLTTSLISISDEKIQKYALLLSQYSKDKNNRSNKYCILTDYINIINNRLSIAFVYYSSAVAQIKADLHPTTKISCKQQYRPSCNNYIHRERYTQSLIKNNC